MKARIAALVEWIQKSRLGRTMARYAAARGPLLSQGLSYQSIFAAFAAIWVAFAIIGLWLRADDPLQLAIVDTIASAVPGLIDQGEGGAVRVDALLSVQILGWTGAIAAVGLCWTVVSWFGSARSAVQAMIGAPERQRNALLLRLTDAGLAAGFGIAILVSAFLSLMSTSLLGAAFDWIGIEKTGTLLIVLTRIAGLVIVYGFDFLVLWALFLTMASGAKPNRVVAAGAALGAFAFGVLKVLGATLLGGAGVNPLLASFAVIIGLLIWFNLACQALLLTAAWIGESNARIAARVGGPN